MNTQTIQNDLAGGGASQGGQGGQPQYKPGSVDALVDAAVNAFPEGVPENDNAGKQVRRSKQARDADAERNEGEEEAVAALDGGEAQDEQQEAEAESPDVQEHEDLRGTKDEPFTTKDLPADKYIELKVDGEKLVVPLSELASGYIREQTFNKRVNKTKLLADEAETMVAKVREKETRLRSELRSFLHDPQQIYDFFLASDDREQVFEAAARKYAELRRLHRERPDERLQFQRRRDQERLAYEREQWENQKRQEHEERTRKEQMQRAQSIFQPGWEAGMRKAGFPAYSQELFDEVMVRCNQKAQRGEQVTSDDVAAFVVRAAKALELPPRGGKKPPAPAPVVPREPSTGRFKQADKRWEGLTQRKKTRDPDYFLRNLKGLR